ncbi:hypothetical protein LX32DRAFT_113459 [Colletotrichum zoysiae]|uniref:Uncharacterized protein n=1 Tax=Colletotrichum zoysiae TaxID=1216348 RepID=A0AAD9HA37_9PEZI|nr:hypothetical protein LX32DRAFT_113459 [Colletotrichum zoysiae]
MRPRTTTCHALSIVVRVTCLRPEADMESLEDILWDDTRQMGRRDFLFSVGPHQLLVGDLVQDSIEKQAKRLLQGVVEINSGHSSDKRIIVFMAYDFGALVVKMALSLAARFQDTYPDVFFQTGLHRLPPAGPGYPRDDCEALGVSVVFEGEEPFASRHS